MRWAFVPVCFDVCLRLSPTGTLHRVSLRCSHPRDKWVWVGLEGWEVRECPGLQGMALDVHITLCYLPVASDVNVETIVDAMKLQLSRLNSPGHLAGRFSVCPWSQPEYGIAQVLVDSPLYRTLAVVRGHGARLLHRKHRLLFSNVFHRNYLN